MWGGGNHRKVKGRSGHQIITNYFFNGVCAVHDLWVILSIECNSQAQKVILVNIKPRSGQHQIQARSKKVQS